MSIVNAVLTRAFDILLLPFAALPPLAGLAVVSLVTAVAMLLVFRATSDQRRLAEVKRAIHAGIFEIRLYNDDLRAIWRAQREILRHNATYLRLSIVPMAWMIVPLVLVVAQLQFHYGYGGIAPGEPVLVTVRLRDGAPLSAALEAPEGIRRQTPPVWLPGAREIVWRLAWPQDGDDDLRLRIGSETYTKALQASDGVVRRSPVRLESGLLNQLLYPSEPPLPDEGPVAAIEVAYPERDMNVAGWDVHWMIVYFVLSMMFAFALRKRFGVTI